MQHYNVIMNRIVSNINVFNSSMKNCNTDAKIKLLYAVYYLFKQKQNLTTWYVSEINFFLKDPNPI